MASDRRNVAEEIERQLVVERRVEPALLSATMTSV